MQRLGKATVLLVGVPVTLVLGLMPAQAANTVTSADIVDQTIQKIDIGPDAVGTSEIVINGVGKIEIATDAVGTAEILTNGVGAAEIAAGAVHASEIATGAVGSSEIATAAVGASEIAADAVGASEIATEAVGESELLDTIQIETSRTYSAASSFQLLAADLTLAPGAGVSSANGGPSAFLGATMGNVLGSNLTETDNYVGGVIGHYSVTGTNASTYPVGAVLGGIGDGTTTADGAFVAYTDGDSALTKAGAAFKVMNNNSTPGSGFNFGLDLQDAAHDGYRAVDENFYLNAPIRMVRDVVVLVGGAAPTAATGAGTAGPGSLYVDTAGAKLYINTGDMTTPDWTVVGTQT
jgi:hypothetical protein